MSVIKLRDWPLIARKAAGLQPGPGAVKPLDPDMRHPKKAGVVDDVAGAAMHSDLGTLLQTCRGVWL